MVARKHDGGFFRVIWGTFDDFWQETSISGANNAGKARQSPYVRRFLWLIIFGVFFGLTVKNVYNLFVTYREYPVTYSSYVSHQKRVMEIRIFQFCG